MLISSKYLPSSCRRSFSGRHSGFGQWQDVLCRSVGVNPHPGTSWSWNAKDKVMKWIIKTIDFSLKDKVVIGNTIHLFSGLSWVFSCWKCQTQFAYQYLDRANAKPSNITVFLAQLFGTSRIVFKGQFEDNPQIWGVYRCLSECLATWAKRSQGRGTRAPVQIASG